MSADSELEHMKIWCKRTELDIKHLGKIIAKIRSYNTDESNMLKSLTRKLRGRVEVLENKMNHIETNFPS